MRERYSAAFEVGASPVSSGGVYAEMLAGATRSISVIAVRAFTGSNVGGMVGLARSFAIGTGTAAGTFTGVAHRTVAQAQAGRAVNAWLQAPTGLPGLMRDVVLPVATGTAVDIWREEDGPIVLEPATSLLALNQGSGINAAPFRLQVTWEEGPL